MDTLITPAQAPWWGEFELDAGQRGRWHIGSLTTSAQHQESEWHICHINTGSNAAESEPSEFTRDAEPLGAEAKCYRHLVKPVKQPLQVLPALADRSVVTRPLIPFYLYPGQQVLLYVGTTVWFQVYAYPSGPLLLDIPIQRPSDTWFGQSTLEGEICYAARTHAILNLNEVPLHPFRAVTPVKITNNAEEPLLLERLLLPITHLSVFSSSNGRLWTEELSILCDEEMRSAHLHLGKGAPPAAKDAQRLNKPRIPPNRGVLTRALGAIFG